MLWTKDSMRRVKRWSSCRKKWRICRSASRKWGNKYLRRRFIFKSLKPRKSRRKRKMGFLRNIIIIKIVVVLKLCPWELMLTSWVMPLVELLLIGILAPILPQASLLPLKDILSSCLIKLLQKLPNKVRFFITNNLSVLIITRQNIIVSTSTKILKALSRLQISQW